MEIKKVTGAITGKFSRQILTVKHHSPALLFGAGALGMVTTVVLACRATLKVSDVLEKGEEHLKKVEVTVTEDGEEVRKASMGVKLKTAIEIAKLYAPATVVGLGSLAAMTGSHVILTRRNVALTAAYAIVQKGFDDYRGRVRNELGAEKDMEFRFGVDEREIVEEGPNGQEVKVIKGLDPERIKSESPYARIFDEYNPQWSNIPHQNPFFVQMVQNQLNDKLQYDGFVFLNDAYDLLGFEKTHAGQLVGWVASPEGGKGDGYVDFGVWAKGTFEGKEWVKGNKDAILLDFNVDGVVADLLKKI